MRIAFTLQMAGLALLVIGGGTCVIAPAPAWVFIGIVVLSVSLVVLGRVAFKKGM